ncbi:MAG: hypothetical protein QM539_01250, partial [Alphaproteobacteria bacterium]|nr:hypothetical protein [Alphaproteobacteria bacterium]
MADNQNIQELFDEIGIVLSKNLKNQSRKSKAILELFLIQRKERYQTLQRLFLNGELSPEDLKERLKEEQLLFEAELNVLAIFSKSSLQKN